MMNTPDTPQHHRTELRGTEGGLWRVSTRYSFHYFDLERGTVTRVPGKNAGPSINDRPRPLRTIDTVIVGERGQWTMSTDGWSDDIDYFWANTSEVISIDAVEPHDFPGAGGVVPA
ncbi:hypothetical protein GY21_08745 [Cryobacterium roopkundense]|uniref:Uncharacterized protein n=1 Tax=Cryobacterium roopkundense TaxID=1001240 RepID=A0A099JH75_9MICO|nr:hypothetical protein [Cryobacterium roopkundense]KGJ76922.1 hypothetical protein GY21_08745 [Cryobacterium roopkundense]MBB5643159.1 hypothetical protein [Cryobacterium roopkundense]